MTGIGAQRKHVTLLTDFRSSPENGHSRYGHPTARFAPKRTPLRSKNPAFAAMKASGGVLGLSNSWTINLGLAGGFTIQDAASIVGDGGVARDDVVVPARRLLRRGRKYGDDCVGL